MPQPSPTGTSGSLQRRPPARHVGALAHDGTGQTAKVRARGIRPTRARQRPRQCPLQSGGYVVPLPRSELVVTQCRCCSSSGRPRNSQTMRQHFWLICGLWCGLLGAFQGRRALRRAVDSGQVSVHEVRTFTRRAALWVLIPCAILWILQQLVGAGATPSYIRWPNPERYVALSVQFFVWGTLLYWVLWRGGADTLSQYVSLARGSSSALSGPTVIQVAAIALVLVGSIGLFAGRWA